MIRLFACISIFFYHSFLYRNEYPEYIMVDGIHLTEEGNQALAHLLKQYIA